MNNRIFLNRKKGFRWFENEQCLVRGCIYDSSGTWHEDERMLNYFGSADTYAEFRERVWHANGCFSVIRKMEDKVWLACDLIRSLPLFFAHSGYDWLIADEAASVIKELPGSELNEEAQLEFRGTGYVTGSETLADRLEMVQAGELLCLGRERTSEFWHSYRVSGTRNGDYESFRKQGKEVMERSFERMIESLGDRTAVVPLSGGYDSRMIAVMLKKAGFSKVICFSYGRKDNPEALISKRVAEKLGFPWHFIEYDEKLIGNYIDSKTFREYFKWASNLSSMFFMQEYFAVQALKETGKIPVDAVFIPGHSGDFIGGSQFAKHGFSAAVESLDLIISRIFRVKYHYADYSNRQAKRMKERIREKIREKERGEEALAYSIHEDWDFKEKFAKFNVNSNATYTFFGYAFRMPYWDHELVEFFRKLPVEFKVNKRLYDDLLVNEYFGPYGVSFETELQNSPRAYAWGRFKKRVKKHLPVRFVNLFTKKQDLLCYREITSRMRDDLRKRGENPGAYGNRYNKVIIEWYLAWVKEQGGK